MGVIRPDQASVSLECGFVHRIQQYPVVGFVLDPPGAANAVPGPLSCALVELGDTAAISRGEKQCACVKGVRAGRALLSGAVWGLLQDARSKHVRIGIKNKSSGWVFSPLVSPEMCIHG